ncbi:MAG TPA: hypothetical protein VGD13_07280, partial [Xanthobacteraceae bacterium]
MLHKFDTLFFTLVIDFDDFTIPLASTPRDQQFTTSGTWLGFTVHMVNLPYRHRTHGASVLQPV